MDLAWAEVISGEAVLVYLDLVPLMTTLDFLQSLELVAVSLVALP